MKRSFFVGMLVISILLLATMLMTLRLGSAIITNMLTHGLIKTVQHEWQTFLEGIDIGQVFSALIGSLLAFPLTSFVRWSFGKVCETRKHRS